MVGEPPDSTGKPDPATPPVGPGAGDPDAAAPAPRVPPAPEKRGPFWASLRNRIPGLRRLGRVGSVAAVVIGTLTALFGAYAGYRSLPQGVSNDDWVRRTNAVCEQNASDLRHPLQDVSGTVQNVTVLIANKNLSAAAADLGTTSRGVQDSADAYRKLVGSMRALERPEDAAEIDVLLKAGSGVAKGLDRIAGDLARVSSNVATIPSGGVQDKDSLEGAMASLATAVSDLYVMQRDTWSAYQQAIIDLKLTECEGWNDTGKPVPVAPRDTGTPTPQAPGTLTADQTALARRLGFEPSQCRPADSPSRAVGALAELNCRGSGLPGDPFFISFSSEESLRGWFGPRADQPGDCGEGSNAERDLPRDSAHPGRLRCFPLQAGGFRVEVMLTQSLVGIAAQNPGPSTLESWITGFLEKPDL
ncbi:MAG: hypothetical protein JWR85_86 [Marmoricola sp.]|nr:hypothetical protein [Marmoricola sp.]